MLEFSGLGLGLGLGCQNNVPRTTTSLSQGALWSSGFDRTSERKVLGSNPGPAQSLDRLTANFSILTAIVPV